MSPVENLTSVSAAEDRRHLDMGKKENLRHDAGTATEQAVGWPNALQPAQTVAAAATISAVAGVPKAGRWVGRQVDRQTGLGNVLPGWRYIGAQQKQNI